MTSNKTVVIVYQSKVLKSGKTKLVKAKPIVRRVVAIYDDGWVMDHTGETWSVTNNTQGRATYITVA